MATVVLPTPANNGISQLDGSLTDSATTINVASASALGVSGITGGPIAYVTITTRATWRKNPETTTPVSEIVKVTSVTSNALTVVRGQDGTSGTAFSDDDIIELLPCAIYVQAINDALTDGTDDLAIGALSYNGDLTQAASGVDKTWSSSLSAPEFHAISTGAMTNVAYQSKDVDIPILPFSETVENAASTTIALPPDYDGSALTMTIFWTTRSGTTGDVIWTVNASILDNDETLAATNTTQQYTADTFIAANDVHSIAKSFTPTGAATGTLLTIYLRRLGNNGSDTLDDVADFIALRVEYT